MSRNPELEALLQAKFDLDTCADEKLEGLRRRYEELLEQALTRVAHSALTREMIEEALLEPYREFRRARIQEERSRLSRLR